MNGLFKNAVASALVASAGIACVAQAADEVSLLLMGPVDAVLPKQHAAVILGQKIELKSPEQLTVGETAAVFGRISASGVVVASEVRRQGPYVAGATTVLLTGVVQKSDNSVGQAEVGGLTVDLTPAMAGGAVSAAVGSTIQVVGTQPGSGGLVLATGITGSGHLSGITGSGLNGITGSGVATNGITGSGHLSGITGSGLNGITGSGVATNGITGSGHLSGITGSGLNGITGSGVATNGITGSGHLNGITGSGLNGITGSGVATNGITGSGHLSGITGSGLNGITGSGVATNGITGSGHLNGITGSGL